MNQLNRIAPSRYFSKERSLYYPINANHFEGKITLFDLLEGPGLDESSLYVKSFVETLSLADRAIIHDFMGKVPRSLVAKKHNLSVYVLKKRLERIGTAYLEGYVKS